MGMSGPPEDVPADELFTRMLARPRPSEVVDFPRAGTDGRPPKMRIMVLHMDEHIEARIQAKKSLCERLKVSPKELPDYLASDATMADTLGDIVACEILAMACIHEKPTAETADSDRPFYPKVFVDGAKQVRERLSTDEVARLYSQYLLIKRQYGPDESTIETEHELTAWIKRLVEGAALVPLAQLDWSQQVELITSLSARAYFLSGILASLWESLPESSRSALETLGVGPTFAFEPPASTTENGSSPSKESDAPLTHADPDAADAVFGALGVEPLTREQAVRAVRTLFNR